MNRRFKQLFAVLSIIALCSAPNVFAMEKIVEAVEVPVDNITFETVLAYNAGDMSINISQAEFRKAMQNFHKQLNAKNITPQQKRAEKKVLTQVKQNFEQQRKQRLAAAANAMPVATKRPHAGATDANANRRPAQAAKGRCRGGVCRPAQATKGGCRGGVCYRGK